MWVITNNKIRNLTYYFNMMEGKYDEIKIASAFFSDNSIIKNFIKKQIKVSMLVSLRYPTSPTALEEVLVHEKISVKYLADDFHSKFYIFYNNGEPVASIIGSSNFTNGGLENNIETNLFSENKQLNNQLVSAFNSLFDQAMYLDSELLNEYKKLFNKKSTVMTSLDDNTFNEILLHKKQQNKIIIDKRAEQYHLFRNIMYSIRDYLRPILDFEYPNMPEFIVIDYFWHWIKTVYAKENKAFTVVDIEKVKALFREFSKWDKANSNKTIAMVDRATNIFNKYLSQQHIDKLTEDEAKLIYRSLHSCGERAIRFHADEKFVKENGIEKIIKSWKYLLYSDEDIVYRI